MCRICEQEIPEVPEDMIKKTRHLFVFNYELHISCPTIILIPKIPDYVNRLFISDCPELVEVKLPLGVEVFLVARCPKLNIPEILTFSSLNTISFSTCDKLVNFPIPPASLIQLNLHDCSNLKNLPELPEEFSRLDIVNCPIITNLSPDNTFPVSLERLYIENCPCILRIITRPGVIFRKKKCPWLTVNDHVINNKNIQKIVSIQRRRKRNISKRIFRRRLEVRNILKRKPEISMDLINNICREYI